MADRALRVLLSALLAATLCVTAVAAPAEGSYEHQWQTQGMMLGELGATSQRVLDSSAELSFEKGTFSGEIHYADLLGMQDLERIVSQESLIDLQLTGTSLQDGTAAGGTFSGTAVLKLRDAGDLDATTADAILAGTARTTTYDVGGHWGVTLTGARAEGEIIFERASLRSGDAADQREPAWFDRASISSADMLGDPQLFTTRVGGLASVAPGTDDNDDTGEGTPTGAGNTTDDGSSSATSARESVFAYILKGIRGVDLTSPMPVPDDLALAARELADARPTGATPMPENAIAIDRDVAGAYLDAKNMAAGFLAEDGPTGPGSASLITAVANARASAEGIPAVSAEEDAGTVWAKRAIVALEPRMSSAGAPELAAQLRAVRPEADRDTVLALRAWVFTTTAAGADTAYGSVLGGTRGFADRLRIASLAEGALADAVLAAADSPRAPASALVVSGFARDTSLDASASPDGDLLPNRVLATSGVGDGDTAALVYLSSAAPRQIAPDRWLAYRRGDDTVFWLPGEDGDVALRDSSVRGWAFARERAALVDASRCGRMLAVFAAK